MERVLIPIIAVAVLALWYAFRIYNRLVAMRNRVRDAWSDIDVQLSFRYGLIPNLVESVSGYMSHERVTLEAVVQARSAAMKSFTDVGARALSESALGTAVGNLFITAERYPELKSSQNFLLLQEQLTTTENRIAFARQHYNETVRQFNTQLAEFPQNMLAQMIGCSPEKMFCAEAQDRSVVQMT
jgi:LemA protein